MSRTQVRVQQLTGSIIDIAYSGSVSSAKADTAVGNDHLGALLGEIAGSIGRISGRTGTGASAFSNGAAGTFYHTLKSDSTGNVDIGSTTDADKFGNVYLGDTKNLFIGAAEEHFVKDAAPGLQIGSSEKIDIGVDSNTQPINIGTVAQAKTITIGDDASTKVDVNALAIELDSAGTFVLDAFSTADLDSGGNFSINSSAAKVILSGSDGADSVHIQSDLTVDGDITAAASLTLTDDLTVNGNLTVNGVTTTVDSDNTVLADRFLALASGSLNTDTDSGIIFNRATADLGGGSDMANGIMLFDGATGNIFKFGVTNDNAEITAGSVADDDLSDVFVGKLLIDGSSNHIDVVSSNLKLTAGADIDLAPATNGDVNIPAVIGLTFGGASQKIEGDASGNLEVSAGQDFRVDVGAGFQVELEIATDLVTAFSASNGSALVKAGGAAGVAESIFLQPKAGYSAGIILNGADSYAAIADDVGNDLLQVTGSAGAPTLVAGGALGSGTTEILTISGSQVLIDNGAASGELALRASDGAELRFDAPTGISSNVTYTFPAAASDGLFLQTNGSGDLSWADPAGVSLKRSLFKVTSTKAAATLNFGSSPTSGLTKLASSDDLDLSSLSDADLLKKVEVYVNGALLISGSAGGADTDYTHISDDELSFEFGLEVDDIVQIIAR